MERETRGLPAWLIPCEHRILNMYRSPPPPPPRRDLCHVREPSLEKCALTGLNRLESLTCGIRHPGLREPERLIMSCTVLHEKSKGRRTVRVSRCVDFYFPRRRSVRTVAGTAVRRCLKMRTTMTAEEGEEANGADATHPKSEKKRKELLHEKVRA